MNFIAYLNIITMHLDINILDIYIRLHTKQILILGVMLLLMGYGLFSLIRSSVRIIRKLK